MTRRILVDTNVWFSALVYRGRPLALIDQLHLPDFQPIISIVLLEELRSTLARKTAWTTDLIDAAVNYADSRSLLILPTLTLTACRDPDDNRILECSIASRADFIVTGDQDLLALHPFRNIPILTVRNFLDSQLS